MARHTNIIKEMWPWGVGVDSPGQIFTINTRLDSSNLHNGEGLPDSLPDFVSLIPLGSTSVTLLS